MQDDKELDGDYFEDRDLKKEPYAQVLKRAMAKERDGEILTDKEKWAMTYRKDPKGFSHPKGPRKPTIDLLYKIAKIQLESGDTYQKIADKLGKSLTTISHVVSKYDQDYREQLKRASEDLVKEAKITKVTVYSRLLNKMQRSALLAPDVIEEVMTDVKQPGGTRVAAAGKFLDAYGVGAKDLAKSEEKTYISDEHRRVIEDTLGIMQKLKAEIENKPVDALEAEIVESKQDKLTK